MAIRQARLERLALSASGHERMVKVIAICDSEPFLIGKAEPLEVGG